MSGWLRGDENFVCIAWPAGRGRGYPGNVRYVQYDPFLVQWLSKFWCSSRADPSCPESVMVGPAPSPPLSGGCGGAGGGDALTHRSWTPGGLHLSSISGAGSPGWPRCSGVSGLILWWFWHPRWALICRALPAPSSPLLSSPPTSPSQSLISLQLRL